MKIRPDIRPPTCIKSNEKDLTPVETSHDVANLKDKNWISLDGEIRPKMILDESLAPN